MRFYLTLKMFLFDQKEVHSRVVKKLICLGLISSVTVKLNGQAFQL